MPGMKVREKEEEDTCFPYIAIMQFYSYTHKKVPGKLLKFKKLTQI